MKLDSFLDKLRLSSTLDRLRLNDDTLNRLRMFPEIGVFIIARIIYEDPSLSEELSIELQRFLEEELSASDTDIAKNLSKYYLEVYNASEYIERALIKALYENGLLSEEFSLSLGLNKAEDIDAVDISTIDIAKILFDTIDIISIINKLVTKSVSDSFNYIDEYYKEFYSNKTDESLYVENISYLLSKITESNIDSSDTVDKIVSYLRTLDNNIDLSEDSVKSLIKSTIDPVVYTESIANDISKYRHFKAIISADEYKTIFKPFSELFSLVEGINYKEVYKDFDNLSILSDYINSKFLYKALDSHIIVTDDVDGIASLDDDQVMQFVKIRTDLGSILDEFGRIVEFYRDWYTVGEGEEIVSNTVLKPFYNSFTAADVTNRNPIKGLLETCITHETGPFFVFDKILADICSLENPIYKTLLRLINDLTNATESATLNISKPEYEYTTSTDYETKYSIKVLSEETVIPDNFYRVVNFLRSWYETSINSDNTIIAFDKVLSDNNLANDAFKYNYYKALLNNISSTETKAKVVDKLLSNELSSSSTLDKLLNKVLANNSITSDAVSAETLKRLYIEGYTTDFETKYFIKAPLDSNNLVDALINNFSKISIDYTNVSDLQYTELLKLLSNLSELSDSEVKRVIKSVNNEAEYSDSTIVEVYKAILSVVNVTDDIDGEASLDDDQIMQFLKTRTDVSNTSDSLYFGTLKLLYNYFESADSIATQTTKPLSNNSTTVDSTYYTDLKAILIESNIADSINYIELLKQLYTEATSLDDISTKSVLRLILDELNLSDSLAVELDVVFTKFFTAYDSVTSQFTKDNTSTATASTDDPILTTMKSVYDLGIIGDEGTELSDIQYTINNGYFAEDYISTVLTAIFVKEIGKNLDEVSNIISTIHYSIYRYLTDSIIYSDSMSYGLYKPLSTEFIDYTDSSIWNLNKGLLSEGTSAETRVHLLAKSLLEDGSVLDTDRVIQFTKVASNTASMLDSSVYNIVRPYTDLTNFSDSNTWNFNKVSVSNGSLAEDKIHSISKILASLVNVTDDVDGEASLDDDQVMQFVKIKSNIASTLDISKYDLAKVSSDSVNSSDSGSLRNQGYTVDLGYFLNDYVGYSRYF